MSFAFAPAQWPQSLRRADNAIVGTTLVKEETVMGASPPPWSSFRMSGVSLRLASIVVSGYMNNRTHRQCGPLRQQWDRT
jgi:hypothetical protein